MTRMHEEPDAPILCRFCGVIVEHDLEAERWLGGTRLYDPNVLDYDVPGTTCEPSPDERHQDYPYAGNRVTNGDLVGTVSQVLRAGDRADLMAAYVEWERGDGTTLRMRTLVSAIWRTP